MVKKEPTTINKISMLSSVGHMIWSIIIAVGVFFATIYSTQSVMANRLQNIEIQISALKENDRNIDDEIKKLDIKQNSLLLDIANRIREMEIKLTELQVKISFSIDEQRKSQKSP